MESAPPLARIVLGGVTLTSAGFVLSRVLTFATYLVLARLAAPSVFGDFAAGTIVLGVGSVFVESGMLAALIHRRDRLEEAANTAFAAMILGGAALALCALATAPLIGLVFSSRQIGLVAAAASGILLLGAVKVVPDALLQRRFSFLRRVVVDPIGVTAFGVTSIIALASGLGVWGLVLGTYASQLAQVTASWKASGFRPRPRLASVSMWRELTRYGRHILASTLVDHVTLIVNTVLLGRLVSSSALGQYRYATRFATLPQEFAVSAGSYVLLPAFSRISHDLARFEAAFLRAVRVVLAAVVPLSLLFLPLGTPLVVLLLGERWRPAGAALMALCVASAIGPAGSFAAESVKGAGRPDVLPVLHLLNAVLVIGFMLALAPFGLVGIAAGVSAGTVAATAFSLWRITRVLHLSGRRTVGAIWPPCVAAVLMIGVLFPLDRFVVHAERHGIVAGLALLVSEALVGLVVYLAVLTPLAPKTAAELREATRAARARIGGPLAPRRPPSHSPGASV